ncbi:hypothetical protein LHYA1_G004357 [Lachnellula hyalina]|uniref:NTF2-like protein n=1 Tax=Lachnellula hyalina TaxID=1316788 RepID=A0A8H8R3E5_9HELO|nr:uncharacterized protein LHYA1_G004357 [Lachnellula hyalina]TVY27723.1 hypothetical protein LHYA1_G004357 [Lachnellula hyalina]
MALQAAYKQFLTTPNASFLASDASLHYITTLTTLHGSAEIIKYLNGQSHELKKEEKFLDVVEGPDSLAVEVHTTVEFQTGGGAYLPSLDDNFLADRIVTLPIIHIVSFDANDKIQQIRQSWDQGSLLKLIDVIGKTGRNWPIRDGKDQINLIVSSVKSTGKPSSGSTSNAADAARSSRANSTNVTRDPHASLSLFGPREKAAGAETRPAAIARASSAKPAQRNYHDLFVGNESDQSPTEPTRPTARERAESPSRNGGVRGKGGAGAGKNYGPSRLFDTEELDEADLVRPSPMKETNSKKYEHFDFGENHDAPARKEKTSKHGTQWGFDDFNTPAKAVPGKVQRANEVRHWGNEDDELVDSPVKHPKVDKPRKDAQAHFEFKDDGTPEAGRRIIGRPRGQGHNDGMGLYRNNVYDDETGGQAGGDEPHKFRPIANVVDRRKDFDSHWEMKDDSPSAKPAPQRISEDRAKAVKMMEPNWIAGDKSPDQKENMPPTAKAPLSDATNAMSHRNDEHKGIATGGNGMGGKKGVGRQWGFGDDSDGEEAEHNKPNKFRTGKQGGKNQVTGGDFWDF